MHERRAMTTTGTDTKNSHDSAATAVAKLSTATGRSANATTATKVRLVATRPRTPATHGRRPRGPDERGDEQAAEDDERYGLEHEGGPRGVVDEQPAQVVEDVVGRRRGRLGGERRRGGRAERGDEDRLERAGADRQQDEPRVGAELWPGARTFRGGVVDGVALPSPRAAPGSAGWCHGTPSVAVTPGSVGRCVRTPGAWTSG